MYHKLTIFSLIGCFIAIQVNAQVASSLDEETLEFLRVDTSMPQDNLLFPPLPESQLKSDIKNSPTQKKITSQAPKAKIKPEKKPVIKPVVLKKTTNKVEVEDLEIKSAAKVDKLNKDSASQLSPVLTAENKSSSITADQKSGKSEDQSLEKKLEATAVVKDLPQGVEPVLVISADAKLAQSSADKLEKVKLEVADKNLINDKKTIADMPSASDKATSATSGKNASAKSSEIAKPKVEKGAKLETLPNPEPKSKPSAALQPLITDEAENDKTGVVSFNNDSYQVSAADCEMLSKLVSGFENVTKNKILIVAYNYDDGESSFKKKRLALNRATEIRSHLIGEGYKNFSIKIINTDDISMKNRAEVSELKN